MEYTNPLHPLFLNMWAAPSVTKVPDRETTGLFDRLATFILKTILTEQFSPLESNQVPWVSWDNTRMVSLSESCSLR